MSLILSSFREYFFSFIGLPQGSRQRKLYDQGRNYMFMGLAEEAKEDPTGIASVTVPFSWLPSWIIGPVKHVVVVRNLSLAREIASYGGDDPASRYPFHMTEDILRVDNLTSRFSSSVPQNRRDSKKVLHNTAHVDRIIQDEVSSLLDNLKGKEFYLEEEFKKMGIRVIGRSIMGIENFPSEDHPTLPYLRLVNLIMEIDGALNTFNRSKIKELEPKIYEYSQWIAEHNKETLLGENSILPHFLGSDISKANLAAVFIATPNIIKLVYASLIYFGCNPEWQEKLRRAFQEGNSTFIRNVYKEVCRFFIPTHIPRYASKETHFKDYSYPECTFFLVPTRIMRFDPDIFPDPMKFDPSRYLENNIKMNSIELSPFGLGPRQCIASGQYTERFWTEIMRLLFHKEDLRLSITSHQEMEDIPIPISFLKLQEKYMARFFY